MNDTALAVQPHLLTNERLLWSGRPDPGVLFTRADLFLVPFGLVWCAFTVFWEYSAIRSGAPSLFPLVGGIFVLVGLYYVFGRFVVKRLQKQRTLYALTSKRALVIGRPGGTVDALIKGQSIATATASDGRHLTVKFGMSSGRFGFGSMDLSNTGLEFFSRSPGPVAAFYDVADVDALSSALAEARNLAIVD